MFSVHGAQPHTHTPNISATIRCRHCRIRMHPYSIVRHSAVLSLYLSLDELSEYRQLFHHPPSTHQSTRVKNAEYASRFGPVCDILRSTSSQCSVYRGPFTTPRHATHVTHERHARPHVRPHVHARTRANRVWPSCSVVAVRRRSAAASALLLSLPLLLLLLLAPLLLSTRSVVSGLAEHFSAAFRGCLCVFGVCVCVCVEIRHAAAPRHVVFGGYGDCFNATHPRAHVRF